MRRELLARWLVVMVVGFSYSLAIAQAELQAPVPARITAPIDASSRVTIAGSKQRMAQPQFDRGPVTPDLAMQRLLLVLGASPEQEHQLITLLDSQHTKRSPDYHRWLTPQEFGKRFGPSAQDLQTVTRWLEQEGFTVGSVAKSGRWIEFSGTVAQVQATFATSMRKYEVAGEAHIANDADISIPAALSPVVKGVVSLHDFFSKPMHQLHGRVRKTADGSYAQLNPDATSGGGVHAISPGDFAAIYDLKPFVTGNGPVGIAIVARSNIDQNDIAAFRSAFALPANPAHIILNGEDPGIVPGDDSSEATLDTEWSGGVAADAGIFVVVSASTLTTDGVDLSAIYIVDNTLAAVISVSFGVCEALLGSTGNNFVSSLWEQASAQGMSVFVSTGDSGAAGCDLSGSPTATHGQGVNGLASTPFNTAVGGTEFNETVNGGTAATFWNTVNGPGFTSAKGYIPEKVWNESCDTATCGKNASLFAGGGGQSAVYPLPSWQSLAIPGLTGSGFTHRVLPDVSLTAAGGHDPYLLCFEGSCQGGSFVATGGTSASAPAFAGIMALVDQKFGGFQGLANYVLYPLASAENFNTCNSSSRGNPAIGTTCVFNDTTAGDNSVPGQIGFAAGTGFDLASGLGSVDFTNLLNAWVGTSFVGTTTALSSTPPGNPLTLVHGQPFSFVVQVDPLGGTGVPTGEVSLLTDGVGNGTVGVAAAPLGDSGLGFSLASFPNISNLPGGTNYRLMARYPGDEHFGASLSASLTVTVTPENSTTTVSPIIGVDNQGHPVLGTTIPYGGFLDLSTVVASSTNTSPPDGFPSGTITIRDNGFVFQTLNLNNLADADFLNCLTAACLKVGSHPIQVSYGGDAGFTASATANPAFTITVTKATPPGVLSAPAQAFLNVPITVSVQLSAAGPIVPSGTVQFVQGTTALGPPVILNSNSFAAAQVTLTGTGNQNVSAQYSGDGTYNPATFGPVTVTLSVPFNFSATTTSQTIAAGATATYNLTLNAVGGFTGSVSFACTGAPGGSTCTVSPNSATLGTSAALTVTVSNTANAHLAPAPSRSLPIVFAAMFAGLLWRRRRKPSQALLALLAVVLIAGVSSCGGGSNPPPPPPPPRPPTVATITVTGTSGSASNTIPLTLTITH